ncbi:MAG: bifunctional adenosylcobinamide kinase/adenosylcobinamide-phosphate guanylyltransferase [Sulfuriferula sp.]
MIRTLVLGGARSGKSAYAEQLAAATGKEVVYVATAQAGDAEMAARIARHRQRRDPTWSSVEEPLALGAAIAEWSGPERLVLVDCLTVWLSNLLFSQQQIFPDVGEIAPPARFHEERQRFLRALQQAAGDVILVSSEVGMGVIPQGAISRWFVDEAGCLNQAVAASCERAVWVAAGLPLVLKD